MTQQKEDNLREKIKSKEEELKQSIAEGKI